jgi:rod shape-determining protein MreD
MSILFKIIVVLFGFLIQSTLLPKLELFGAEPVLMIIILMIIVRNTTPVQSILFGFFIGFIQDIYTPEALGINAFSYSLISYLLVIINEHFTVEGPLYRSILTFFIVILYGLLYLPIYTGFSFSEFGALFIRECLPSSVYTAFVSLIVLFAGQFMDQLGVFVLARDLLGFRR